MGTIAKGEITLSPVNDAYTVLLTPSSCSISADFDGSNPNLTNAKGTITVKRGTKIVPFKVRQVVYSSAGISVSWSLQEVTTLPFAITKLANTILDGYVKFQITTQDGFNYTTEVQFSFNVVRESTMLDWIQDWEGSKTKVGGTYIMTPKLFVGKKEAVIDTSGTQPTWKEGALTGVYIGPDLLASGESSVGIYGYLKSKEIFHINADGGFIGGWTFNEGGLQSSNGVVNILSEGSVFAQDPKTTTPYWGLYADGHAVFANGNVKFQANGSAEFAGKITSTSGKIGGWDIRKDQLTSQRLIIDSAKAYIGINASFIQASEINDNYIFPDAPEGGVKMWYTSNADFGFAGWKSGNKVFQLGSANFIAGWNFDNTSFWSGVKNDAIGAYTTSGITIGTNGLRGIKWRIDSNGDVSFMGGKIVFTSSSNSGEIVGWKLNESRFSTDKITLVSDDANTGLYMSAAANSQFNSRSAASLENFIDSYGGIYLKVKADSADLAAYDLNGKRIFKIKSNGISRIAGWNFDNTTLYTGTAAISGYTNTGEITLGPTGLRGYKWRFENDGSGGIAGDNIKWNANGDIEFGENVVLQWTSIVDAALGNSLTHIDANGVYTGEIHAAQITAGKINAGLLDVEDIFANGQITAAQVLCPFVQIEIPEKTSSYCGFNLSKAYNSYFTPSDRGHYIFLPCDISQSGRTITIHYAQTDGLSAPQNILCNHINARFLSFYRAQSNNPKIRAIQFSAGQTIQMIAIPHRANMSDSDAFVDWYLIGYSDELTDYPLMYKDDVITDELWSEYHSQIIDII